MERVYIEETKDRSDRGSTWVHGPSSTAVDDFACEAVISADTDFTELHCVISNRHNLATNRRVIEDGNTRSIPT